MEIPWDLVDGPEYADSVSEARTQAPDPDRFDGQLKVLRAYVKSFPFEAESFLNSRGRVRETIDEAGEFSLAIYYVIKEKKWCIEVKWIELTPLEA